MINKDAPEEELTLVGRLTRSLFKLRLGFFFAELVLVVVGVLIALAVDGWISDSRDRQTERVYLELLVRDIEGIRRQADLQIEFEQERIDAAARTYKALSSSDPRAKRSEIRSALALLITRRTVNMRSATYDQMVSSGHLQLITNHELRNEIVRFFAEMERNEQIMNNNNRELIDDVFVPFVMRIGVSALVQPDVTQVTTTLNRSNAIVYERLGSEFSLPEDRVLLEPAEAESWNDMRRNVLFRMRIAAAGLSLTESTLDQISDIATAIGAELNDS